MAVNVIDGFAQLSPWFQLPIMLVVAGPVAWLIAEGLVRVSDWVGAARGRIFGHAKSKDEAE